MLTRIGNFVAFQAGWVACILGAAHGRSWAGLLIVLLLFTVHVWQAADRWSTSRFVLMVAMIGAIIDSVLGYAGVLVFRDSLIAGWLCPPWLVGLWLIFATTLRSSLAWLAGRDAWAAPAGAFFGPLSYYGGQELGALQLGGRQIASLLILGIVWALLLPWLLRLGQRCDPASQ